METVIELTEDELGAVVGGESVTITVAGAISGTNVGLSGTFNVATTLMSSTVSGTMFVFSSGPVQS